MMSHKLVYSMNNSNHIFPIRVYYEDTDAGGVVYHANYLKFMERARSELLVSIGCSVVRCEQEFGVLFVVSHMNIHFSASAKLGDELNVETEIIKLGKVRMIMQQNIYNKHHLLICSALVKLAAVKKSVNGPAVLVPIPSELVEKLSAENR